MSTMKNFHDLNWSKSIQRLRSNAVSLIEQKQLYQSNSQGIFCLLVPSGGVFAPFQLHNKRNNKVTGQFIRLLISLITSKAFTEKLWSHVTWFRLSQQNAGAGYLQDSAVAGKGNPVCWLQQMRPLIFWPHCNKQGQLVLWEMMGRSSGEEI